MTVQTHPLPHNAGNASADTQVFPFPLPSAAHLLLRFSPHFHQRGLSVDAPATLLPPQRFSYDRCIKPQKPQFVKHLFRHFSLRAKLEFIEPKEYVIAKPARRLVVAISKVFHLRIVGFFAFSEGIATSGFALLAMTAFINRSTNYNLQPPYTKKRERKIRSLFKLEKYGITYRRVPCPERGGPLRSGSSAVPRDPRCRRSHRRSCR